MAGACVIKEVGSLRPAFTASEPFVLEITPQIGVLKWIDFFIAGTHSTLITEEQTDGVQNIFRTLRVIVNRFGMRPIEMNLLARDWKQINTHMAGQQEAENIVLADGGAFSGGFRVPFALPGHLTDRPDDWGIPTNEIDGPILIEGTYNTDASLGTAGTAIVATIRVSTCIEENPLITPAVALVANNNRIAHVDETEQGPDAVSVGNMERVWGVYIRHHDDSEVDSERPDGLVTRHVIDHDSVEKVNEQFQALKRRTARFFGVADPDVPTGVALPVFANRGVFEDMLDVRGARRLLISSDSAEAVPADTVNVVPGAGDAVYVAPIGIMFNRDAARIRAAGPATAARAAAARAPAVGPPRSR